ncbi:MAG: radical SAM protein [Promethearchaeota archaeon]
MVRVDEKSGVPVYGLDFLGIVDRGTNIIELKPITTCNIYCRYCFVNAGKHPRNFVVDLEYLVGGVREMAEFKGEHDLEVHIAPYGESLTYPQIVELVKACGAVDGVATISMQSNGLLLSPRQIDSLEKAGLTRINISLNTFDEELARYLSCKRDYDIGHLLQMLELVLDSNIDLLLAPVWFPKKNEESIPDIIEYVKGKRRSGHSEREVQLGIQKYLQYKHGRQLTNIRERTFAYFYKQLRGLEKEHDIKLVLHPRDFGIHPRPTMRPDISKGDFVSIEVVCQGRSAREWIGRLPGSRVFAAKVHSPVPLAPGQVVRGRVSKARAKENLVSVKVG